MPIMFHNGKPLFRNGKIAMSENCCCNCTEAWVMVDLTLSGCCFDIDEGVRVDFVVTDADGTQTRFSEVVYADYAGQQSATLHVERTDIIVHFCDKNSPPRISYSMTDRAGRNATGAATLVLLEDWFGEDENVAYAAGSVGGCVVYQATVTVSKPDCGCGPASLSAMCQSGNSPFAALFWGGSADGGSYQAVSRIVLRSSSPLPLEREASMTIDELERIVCAGGTPTLQLRYCSTSDRDLDAPNRAIDIVDSDGNAVTRHGFELGYDSLTGVVSLKLFTQVCIEIDIVALPPGYEYCNIPQTLPVDVCGRRFYLPWSAAEPGYDESTWFEGETIAGYYSGCVYLDCSDCAVSGRSISFPTEGTDIGGHWSGARPDTLWCSPYGDLYYATIDGLLHAEAEIEYCFDFDPGCEVEFKCVLYPDGTTVPGTKQEIVVSSGDSCFDANLCIHVQDFTMEFEGDGFELEYVSEGQFRVHCSS